MSVVFIKNPPFVRDDSLEIIRADTPLKTMSEVLWVVSVFLLFSGYYKGAILWLRQVEIGSFSY